MSLLPLALQAIREGEGSPAYQALSEAAAQGARPYPYIIAVDFDGTLCENNWPEIGRENRKMLKVLPLLRKLGVLLVLWSCREEDDLADAVEWCRERGVEFDAANEKSLKLLLKRGALQQAHYLLMRCLHLQKKHPYFLNRMHS